MTNVSEKQDLAYELARNVARVEFTDIPFEAVEIAKKSTLDTLGVIVGASGITPGLKEVVGLIRETGGREESTILGFGGRVPAWMAAFANAAMAHCLDYDDMFYGGASGHLSSAVVPAAFAVAERLGNVNGKELIAAIALGQDLLARLLLSATKWRMDWHPTPLFGVFAATAAAGKLLRLDENQLVNAFGIALCQAAGTMELRFGVGSDVGGMYAAFPAWSAVLAGLMAQRGVSGIKSSFEGKAGLFNVYFRGDYNREALTSELGRRFESTRVGYKPWPSCAGTHAYIDATLKIVTEFDIHPEDIEEITVFVGDLTRNLCEPLEARRKPETTMDAKFSIPFSVAVAAANRSIVIRNFTPEGIKDKQLLKLAQRVNAVKSPEFNSPGALLQGMVEIKTKVGDAYRRRVDHPYGHPQQPMSMVDIVEKFNGCASCSVKPMRGDNVEKVIQMVANLEQLEEVGQIVRLLS